MSALDEKLEQHQQQEGRARQSYAQHLKRYEAQQVRYVGEECRPALEVLAESGHPSRGEVVAEVVAVHSMPHVFVWQRVSGRGESDWWGELLLVLQAEWDSEGRGWRLRGTSRTESRGWPSLAPREFHPGLPRAEGAHHVELQHPVSPVSVHAPARRRPRRR